MRAQTGLTGRQSDGSARPKIDKPALRMQRAFLRLLMKNLSTDVARSLLSYCQETGVVRWKVTRCGRAKQGEVAGGLTSEGYLSISVLGIRYALHRVIWLMQTGDYPKGVVDHRNGMKSDNRWCNLRDSSLSENAQNLLRARRDNKSSGVLGVTATARGRPWQATIRIDGRSKSLGRFDTIEAAHNAYLAAKRIHHPTAALVANKPQEARTLSAAGFLHS